MPPGHSRWFERLLAELGFEVWAGDPAGTKTRRVKKHKTDRKDAQPLLRLMLEDNSPRIWVPSPEKRDLRQLLWHGHRLVQMRTRIKHYDERYRNQQIQSLKKKAAKLGLLLMPALPYLKLLRSGPSLGLDSDEHLL